MTINPEQAASHATAARIGRWIVPAIPIGWTWIPSFGIQMRAEGVVPSTVCLGEDRLLVVSQLEPYIKAQIAMIKKAFEDPVIAGPAPLAFPDADEAALLMLKHRPTQEGSVFQVQHYIRSGQWVGIATLSTLESEVLKVRPAFDHFMKLIRIEPEQG